MVRGVGVTDLKTRGENGAQEKAYLVWRCMLDRCYGKSVQKKQWTYIGCTVCDEWLVYSRFKKWFDKNYFEGAELDKDILVEGNREYSPKFCVMVPSKLNLLFGNATTGRRKGFRFGVRKVNGKFGAAIKVDGEYKWLGRFNTHEEAATAWLSEKRRHVRKVVDDLLREGVISGRVATAVLRRKIIRQNHHQNMDTSIPETPFRPQMKTVL